MLYDFPTEYSQRTDDELLHLASCRHSLTTEAAAALNAELRRRNLTESDRIEHQRFVKRQEQRETASERRRQQKVRRWKDRLTYGALKDRMTWLDIVRALATMALISFAYFAVPSRYRIKPDWQEAAACMMIASVLVVVASTSAYWRTVPFWISLIISSSIHLVAVHALTHRVGELGRGGGKLTTLLGFVLFFVVYGCVRLLQRKFRGEEVVTPPESA